MKKISPEISFDGIRTLILADIQKMLNREENSRDGAVDIHIPYQRGKVDGMLRAFLLMGVISDAEADRINDEIGNVVNNFFSVVNDLFNDEDKHVRQRSDEVLESIESHEGLAWLLLNMKSIPKSPNSKLALGELQYILAEITDFQMSVSHDSISGMKRFVNEWGSYSSALSRLKDELSPYVVGEQLSLFRL